MRQMNQSNSLVELLEQCKPIERPKPARTRLGRWLRQWWAMIQLRRMFAKDGVPVWKYSDEELKEQCKEGLRKCTELVEQDYLERLYKM